MEAKELRIGNYVFVNENTPVKIEYFTHYGAYFGNGIGSYNNFKPIPLNEEWLLKFGFEKSNLIGFEGGWQHQSDSKYFIQQMSNAVTIHLIGDEIISLLTGFHYVHQLQNLYFALTGEELSAVENLTT